MVWPVKTPLALGLVICVGLAGCLDKPVETEETAQSVIVPGWISGDPVPLDLMIKSMKLYLIERNMEAPATIEELIPLQKNCLNEIASNRILVREGAHLDDENTSLRPIAEAVLEEPVAFPEGFERLADAHRDWIDRVETRLQLIRYAALISEHLSGTIHVSDEEIQSAYTANIERYTVPMEVELRMIRVFDLAMAEDLSRKLKAGWDFIKLAERFSNLTGKGARGEKFREYITEFPSEFAEDLKRLPLRTISRILASHEGYHILKIDQRYPERILPLDKVRDTLLTELESKKRNERFRRWLDNQLSLMDVQMGTPIPLQEIRYDSMEE
ncbi:peptidyl-prolyl cis-trans isomerase [bacterium]|nr:peptidyl-prolyl cis-trans isomerase [candidate division CSSED10-310 bacterium]